MKAEPIVAAATARPVGFQAVSRSLTPVSYCAPIVVFGVLTALEAAMPREWYPQVYTVKIAAVAASLLVFRGPLSDIRPSRSALLASVMLGLVVFAAWVGIDRAVPYPHLGGRVAFDPFGIGSAFGTWAFLAIRFFGLVLVVPVMEELFWRSFLLRYLTTADFSALAIGMFSMSAFWMVVAASALSHPEWLVAAIANGIYSLWLRRTRSVFTVVVAHASTNAALGIFVITTHAWQYW